MSRDDKADGSKLGLLDSPSRATVPFDESSSLNNGGVRSIIDFVDAIEVSKLALRNSTFAFFHSPNIYCLQLRAPRSPS